MIKPVKKLIYLDYAATTPVRPEVVRAMKPYLSEKFGNPSSLYKLGMEAKNAIETARKNVADILLAKPEEVVFTAGGSESVSLAILGLVRAVRQFHSTSPLSRGGARTRGHIITSAIEHHAVLRSVDQLEQEGFAVTRIGVDKEGFFDINALKKAIRPDTVLVSLMYANNEIGTVEPIREVAKIIREENLRRFKLTTHHSPLTPIKFHTDACQATGFLDLNVQRLGVDMLSINSSKIYGPKQVGALFVRKGVFLEPIIFGGGQEWGLRSGTENVAGVVGFARALGLVVMERDRESKRLQRLRDYLVKEIVKRVPDAIVNGPSFTKTTEDRPSMLIQRKVSCNRLPNNINITIPDCEGEALMMYLDAFGIAVSTGSACTTTETDPSHVLLALGLSKKSAKESIRITLGKFTTKQELDYFLKVLPDAVRLVRQSEKVVK